MIFFVTCNLQITLHIIRFKNFKIMGKNCLVILEKNDVAYLQLHKWFIYTHRIFLNDIAHLQVIF
jgi:hypothetical protein